MSRRIACFLAVCAVLVWTAPIPASAETADLGVAPSLGVRRTEPGRTVQDSVSIVNLSDVDLQVEGAMTDLATDGSGSFSGVSRGAGLPSAADWGVIQPAAFSLPRGYSKNVRISFTPPKGVLSQAYYAAAVFISGRPGGAITRSVHPVLLEVGGSTLLKAAKIASLSSRSVTFGSSITVTLQLQSTGNSYVIATGNLTVTDAASRVAAILPITRTPVIPGAVRTLRFEIRATVLPGPMRISAAINFGSGVPVDSATTSVFVLAWWHMFVAADVAFVAAWVVFWFVRSRRRRRAPVLAPAGAGAIGAARPRSHPVPVARAVAGGGVAPRAGIETSTRPSPPRPVGIVGANGSPPPLSERVLAGVPAGRARGPESAARRALVAVEVLTAGSAGSSDRFEIALKLLEAAGPLEAGRAVHAAFEETCAAGNTGARGPLVLALDSLGDARATEALLRTYADPPKGFVIRIRDALRARPQAELRRYPALLDALPPERLSSLRLG